jgi:putative membrane protein
MPAEPWEDDDRIGVPVAGTIHPVKGDHVFDVERGQASDEIELRPGESDLGKPPQVPTHVAPLTDDDRHRLRQAEEEQALRDLAEAEEMLASDPALIRWAGWFAHPLAAAFLVGTVGVLGLFLYSQTITILSQIATLQPVWMQYAAYGALGLLAAAVLYAMLRLTVLYVRLQRNRQLRLSGLEELHSRTRLRWLAHAKAAEAKSRLEEYLRTFPIDTEKNRRFMARVGVTEEMAAELARVREELLDPARYASSGEWFERFRTGFQGKLDEAAAARISYWSNRAMIVTAVSPNALVDSLSTSYFGFTMIADLCRVYNLKAGRTGTAVLLGRVFFNAYLSGQISDVEKLVEEQYDQIFQQGFHVIGAGVGSNVAGKFLGKVGAKATTGYLNRVLLNRLGKYACRLLRPVTRE